MPKRKHKKYSRPKKIHDIALMAEEKGLISKYGLKNRKEIWKANHAIEKIRNIAKRLITADEKQKEKFVQKQIENGFAVSNIADILALGKEDYLKRRLQSIIVKKGMAKTHSQARQFIVHKHIKTAKGAINAPSHLTTIGEESEIESDAVLPQNKIITDKEAKILETITHKNKSENSGEEE